MGDKWLPAGHRLQEFEIEGVVGEGGFSVVYLARDTRLHRRVALKEFIPANMATRLADGTVQPRDARQAETFALGMRSFINEAQLLASFDHPSLVRVYRFWEENGTAYMVMPYVEAPTLKAWLTDHPGEADEAWIRGLVEPLIDALDMMHASRCYHRDIAPDNILLIGGGNAVPLRPLLLDLGAARRVLGDATQALTVIVKPGYAPIEQYAHTGGIRQGAWTDAYALCAVMYAIVTGRAPVPSASRVIQDTLVPAAQYGEGRFSTGLLSAIDAGLAIRPEARPQSMLALRELLGVVPEGPARVESYGAPTMVIPVLEAEVDELRGRQGGGPHWFDEPSAPPSASGAPGAAGTAAAAGAAASGAAAPARAPSSAWGRAVPPDPPFVPIPDPPFIPIPDPPRPAVPSHGPMFESAPDWSAAPAARPSPAPVPRSRPGAEVSDGGLWASLAGAAQSVGHGVGDGIGAFRPRLALALIGGLVALLALLAGAIQLWRLQEGATPPPGPIESATGSPPSAVDPSMAASAADGGASAPQLAVPADPPDPEIFAATAPPAQASAPAPAATVSLGPPSVLRDVMRQADPGMFVALSPDKPRVVIDQDRVHVRVHAIETGFLYLYMAATDGRIYLLYPNRIDRDNRIRGGQWMSLPTDGWNLRAEGPPGTTHFLAVVSRSRRDLSSSAFRTGRAIQDIDARVAEQQWRLYGSNPLLGRIDCPDGAAGDCLGSWGAALASVEEIDASTARR